MSRTPLKPNFAESYWMYGKHPVFAALLNPDRDCFAIAMTPQGSTSLEQFLSQLSPQQRRIVHNKLATISHHMCRDSAEFRTITKIQPEQTAAQGIALRAARLLPPEPEEIFQQGRKTIILDKITDPHNIGAIIRTAAAFSYGAVMTLRQGSPVESATIAKSAAGGLELTPYVLVTNLVRTMELAKKAGYAVIGLDGTATQELHAVSNYKNYSQRKIFILGSEDSGMRRLVKEKCDLVLRIGMTGQIESLNVSNAAAITLHYDHVMDASTK